ncbi:HAMP domain-containing histidine kinase [Myxococcota bacterium]|nr:HAMP domain-containing histidine kinase [Myxococcota bacterium]
MRVIFIRHWTAFRESFDIQETLTQTGPAALLFTFLLTSLLVFGPAYVEPLASSSNFRMPWLPVSLVSIGLTLSFVFWGLKGRGNIAALAMLLDTPFYVAALAFCVVLTDEPASHAYAMMLALMLLSSQARQHSFNLLFALVITLPSLAVFLFFPPDWVSLLIISFGTLLALWVSAQTGKNREIRKQNISLRTALTTTENIADSSMDIALAQLLVGLGSFVHTMKNNQLSVQLNLELLKDTEPTDDDFAIIIEDVIAAQKESEELISQTLRELRDEQKLKIEGFDALDILREISSGANSSMKLSTSLPSGEFLVQGSADFLRQTALDLIQNSADAGATQLELSGDLLDGGDFLRLSFKDNGPGLSDELLENLFKPFMTRGKKTGTGLGLYLARRRIQFNGGKITAQNTPEGGAEFTILLPAAVSTVVNNDALSEDMREFPNHDGSSE